MHDQLTSGLIGWTSGVVVVRGGVVVMIRIVLLEERMTIAVRSGRGG